MEKQVDCRLAMTDSPVADQPEYTLCPNHDDSAPSFAIYANGGYCHVCHFYLPSMKTLAYLLYGRFDAAATHRAYLVAEKYTSDAIDAYRARVDKSVKTDPLPMGLARAYSLLLHSARQDRMQWLFDRGLTRNTIHDCMLGHDGTRFTIPVFDDDHLLTIRFRRDDHYGTTEFDPRTGQEKAIPKYSGMRGRNGLFLYRVVTPEDWVVVCEGELDVVRLYQEGIPAVSPTNGAGNVSKVPALLQRDYPQVKRLFFATDMDEAGRLAQDEGLHVARQLGYSISWLAWNHAQKDVTELYLAGGSLEEAKCYGDETSLPR